MTNQALSMALVLGEGEVVVGGNQIEEVVGHSPPFGRTWLGGANVKVLVNLTGVGTEDGYG
jgi:hypothetical protein